MSTSNGWMYYHPIPDDESQTRSTSINRGSLFHTRITDEEHVQGVGLGPMPGVCVGMGVGIDVEVGVGDAVNVGVGGTALSAGPAPGVCINTTLPSTTG